MKVKRSKQIGMNRKSLANVQAAVKAFAKQYSVKPEDVRFEVHSGWSRGTYMVVMTPETEKEKERREAAARAQRRRKEREKKQREKYAREQAARRAASTVTDAAKRTNELNQELADAVIALMEGHPAVKKKVLKKVGQS